MARFVILEIVPDGIDAAAWAEAHDTTLRLLAAPPLKLMGLDWGMVCGTMVPLYTRSIERYGDTPGKRHWCVAGERTTLRTAEPQTLYRDLAHYRRGNARPPAIVGATRSGNGARHGHVAHSAGSADILRFAADEKLDPAGRPVQVFGDDTRDEPFHLPLLAAAMVIESRFPLHALASGGFDRARAQAAQHLAESALSTAIPLPVRADASRLRQRLRGFLAGDALDRAFRKLCLDRAEAPERARAATLQAAAEPFDEWAAGPSVANLSLERRDDVHALALGVRRLQHQVGDLHARAEARRSGSDRGSALFALGCGNASLSRRAIAAILAERGPTLTEDAWDWIAREDDRDVLDFLLTLAAVQSGSLDFFHLRRAMFESPALCRHAVNAAKDEALMAWMAEKLSAEPLWLRRGR